MELIQYLSARAFLRVLNSLPLDLRLWLIWLFIRVVTLCIPRYRRIATRNIQLAFPEMPAAAQKNILSDHYHELARVIVDFARLPSIDAEWIREHVDTSDIPDLEEIRAEAQGNGLIIATGHLGSFELLGHCAGYIERPVSVIYRSFKNRRLDSWWRHSRELSGNTMIPRKGAIRAVMQRLQEGKDVALLFDQNVTKNHAVFVNWFGVPAATTRTVATCALKLNTRIIVAGIAHIRDDQYKLYVEPCECSDLVANNELTLEEKIYEITQRISTIYEGMIRKHPAAWFWLHRRWKTRPAGEPSLYV